jgi:glycerol-3-phosphate dehydrogenase subunit B
VSATTPRVVVVGAGIAGAAAALAATESHAEVTVLDGGPGASALATGALDEAPWQPDERAAKDLPPAARSVLCALDAYVVTARAAWLLTTAGIRRPAQGRDAALFDAAPLAGRALGVVRCARPGWDAVGLARAWGNACMPLDAVVLRHVDERAIPDADFAARHDDETRLGWLSERLREALAGAAAGHAISGLVLPPSLGIDRARATELTRRVGIPCGEALATPAGPSGLRFERARDRALLSAGVRRVQARASCVERARAGPGWRVTLDDGSSLDADAVVLATGGLLGGGIAYEPSETLLAAALPLRSSVPLRTSIDAPVRLGLRGRPLEVPGSLFGLAPERIAWPFSPDGLLARAGVLVSDGGRCVGAAPGLLAAGEIVADTPHTWLRALIDGSSAGRMAAEVTCEASPARAPASRP